MQFLSSLDSALLSWILSLPHPPWLDSLMIALSTIGQVAGVWIVLGVLLAAWQPRHTRGVWQLGLAILLTLLLVDGVIKPLVGRERPSPVSAGLVAIIEPPDTTAFPSGHAASSFAGASALARLVPRARIALWALAALIAASRLYLGVHYPLDVVAGALVGLGCATFAVGGTIWYSRDPAVRDSHVPR